MVLRFASSDVVLQMVCLRGSISFTSERTVQIRSLTCASVSCCDSTFSYMTSKISLLSWTVCVSVWLCRFASERILLRNVSTGFSKTIRQVIAQSMSVVVAVMYRYVSSGMAWSLSLMYG